MRRAPGALVPSSEDDEVDTMNKEYRRGSWVVLPLQTMDSIPFSDVSHAPYAQDSLSYLNSTSAASFQNTTNLAEEVGGEKNEFVNSPRIANGRDNQDVHTPRNGVSATEGPAPSTGASDTPVTNRGPQPRSVPKSRRMRRPAPLTAEEKATMIALIQQEHIGALQRTGDQAHKGERGEGEPESIAQLGSPPAQPEKDAAPPRAGAAATRPCTERILPRPDRKPPPARPDVQKTLSTEGTLNAGKHPSSSPSTRSPHTTAGDGATATTEVAPDAAAMRTLLPLPPLAEPRDAQTRLSQPVAAHAANTGTHAPSSMTAVTAGKARKPKEPRLVELKPKTSLGIVTDQKRGSSAVTVSPASQSADHPATTAPVQRSSPVLVTLPRVKRTTPQPQHGSAPAFPSQPAAPTIPTSAVAPAAPATKSTSHTSVERVLPRPTGSHAPSAPAAKAEPVVAPPKAVLQTTPPSTLRSSSTQATTSTAALSESAASAKSGAAKEESGPDHQQAQVLSPTSPTRRRRRNGRRGCGSSTQSLSASNVPGLRPDTAAPSTPPTSASARPEIIHDPSTVQRARQAKEDRLVSFVESVSDPEVLHVIHDYLVEFKANEPRFEDARTICERLLSQKESLLDAKDRNKGRRQVGAHVESPLYLASGLEAFAGEPDLDAALAALAALAAGESDEDEDHDALLDEFDDLNTNNRPYPHQTQFRFGEPTVSGVVSKVFAEGMLFKISDERNAYYFFNDTIHQVMMVRVQLALTGKETIGPKVMVDALEDGSGLHEVTAVIVPEETKLFISDVARLPRVTAKAVQTPDDFIPPSVTASMKEVAAGIEEVRRAMGQWGQAANQKDYLKCCLKNNLRFTDLEFRPSAASLFRPSVDVVKIMPLTWRRPQDYLYFTEVSEARLFRGQISCHLVKQGELNDHTVVAGMAAIAQRPQHVEWLFRHPVSAALGRMERARGAYTVRLLQNGWWTTFLLDDYLPSSVKGPLFARDPSDPRRLWVSLLEKAYAKSRGSYSALCLCDIMMVLSDFTGFPVRYLEDRWVQAQLKPTGHPSTSLFKFLERCTTRKYLIVLFTPSSQDATDETQSLHRKRSLRFIPVNGVMPQFLPGRIYFLTQTACYEELGLRMVRLKNPWTWESVGASELEKKWKYTSWYDQPDTSVSLASATTRLASILGDSAGVAAEDDGRRGTMWMEWGEALKSFAGGGVCYAAWDWTQYRVKNQFDNGLPSHVLEVRVLTKIEGFVTITLDGVRTTLNDDGAVVDRIAQQEPFGVAIVLSRHNKASNQEEIVGRSCDDPESFAGRPTFVQARDVSMKVSLVPEHSPYYIVPQLDPSAVEHMRTQAKTAIPFVLSLVLDTPCVAGKMEVRFKALKPTCPVFANATPFALGPYSSVKATYQCTGPSGVVSGESTKLTHDLPTG